MAATSSTSDAGPERTVLADVRVFYGRQLTQPQRIVIAGARIGTAAQCALVVDGRGGVRRPGRTAAAVPLRAPPHPAAPVAHGVNADLRLEQSHVWVSHAIRVRHGRFMRVRDNRSSNGTFVNGVQINRTSIRHGDRIRVGTSEFVFLTGQNDDADAQPPGVGRQTTSGTLTAVFLDQRSGLPANSSGIGRMARDLSAFFKSADLVKSFRDVDTLQRELLALIFEVIRQPGQ